jgi:hypothetical protein
MGDEADTQQRIRQREHRAREQRADRGAGERRAGDRQQIDLLACAQVGLRHVRAP